MSRVEFLRILPQLRAAREIVRREAAGVWKVSYRLSSSFCEAVKLLLTCQGCAIVTGVLPERESEVTSITQKMAAGSFDQLTAWVSRGLFAFGLAVALTWPPAEPRLRT